MHLFWECSKYVWFSLVNVFEHINAPNIILGIVDPLDPDNTKNQVILILKYLYKCRCLGDKPSINGGLQYLEYCITIEKTTINFISSTQKKYIYVKSENVLGVWNFSEMLQNVCFDIYIYIQYTVYIHCTYILFRNYPFTTGANISGVPMFASNYIIITNKQLHVLIY